MKTENSYPSLYYAKFLLH